MGEIPQHSHSRCEVPRRCARRAPLPENANVSAKKVCAQMEHEQRRGSKSLGIAREQEAYYTITICRPRQLRQFNSFNVPSKSQRRSRDSKRTSPLSSEIVHQHSNQPVRELPPFFPSRGADGGRCRPKRAKRSRRLNGLDGRDRKVNQQVLLNQPLPQPKVRRKEAVLLLKAGRDWPQR